MNKKVLVAMSGGVDSSVAALLLQQQGYDCIGVTMKLYESETLGRGHTCCGAEDIEDARSAACRIGIPYHVFNFAADFEREVIGRFAKAYESGGTPNPCIDCNRYLKFDRLYRRAQELGCDAVATGHYARIVQDAAGRFGLYAALDESKDQSYVLYDLTQEKMARTLLPLGGLHKTQVRRLAQQAGLLNAHKHDSEDICFVPDGDYAAFLERYTGHVYPQGAFIDENGNVLGQHRGLVRYTLGQRKGLGISAATPLYVTAKDAEKNTVTLGPAEALLSRTFTVADINWLDGAAPEASLRAEVCIRYHAKPAAATIVPLGAGMARVLTDAPLRAVTPGQAAVFYRGGQVLGGGRITAAEQPASCL